MPSSLSGRSVATMGIFAASTALGTAAGVLTAAAVPASLQNIVNQMAVPFMSAGTAFAVDQLVSLCCVQPCGLAHYLLGLTLAARVSAFGLGFSLGDVSSYVQQQWVPQGTLSPIEIATISALIAAGATSTVLALFKLKPCFRPEEEEAGQRLIN